MDFVWLIALCISHIAVYYMGRHDGGIHEPSEEAWVMVEKYELDKRFEHMRWIEERRCKHENSRTE